MQIMAKNGLDLTIDFNIDKILKNHNLDKGGKAQKFIDSEVLRLSEPYVPKDSNELIRSGIRNTKIGGGEVVWKAPYARRHYYIPAKFQGAPMRGNHWGERAIKNGGLLSITNGLKAIVK